MTITRVQQVTAVLSGVSDTVTLSAAPQYGNTLIAVLARAGTAPIATSLTQDNVTWYAGSSANNGTDVGSQIWRASNIGPNAGQTVTIARGDTDDYLCILVEYAGLSKLAGDLFDVHQDSADAGNFAYVDLPASPTDQEEELLLAFFAHIDSRTLQTDPSDLFVETAQLTESPAEPSAVVLGLFEKHVNSIVQPTLSVQFERYVVWASQLQTLRADLSVEVQKTADLDCMVVDAEAVTADTDVLVCEERTTALTLDVSIAQFILVSLDVQIDGPVRLANLDVLVAVERTRTAELDANIITGIWRRKYMRLNCYVTTVPYGETYGPVPVRKTAKLDVPILALPAPSNVVTTPEDYRYLNCRSLWCNVPKMKRVSTGLDVSTASYYSRTVTLDMHVQTSPIKLASLQVFIAPEP